MSHMLSVFRLLVLLVCVLGNVPKTYAQTVDEIKESQVYVWGDGKGATIDEAEQAALTQMSRQISVNVLSKTSVTFENGEELKVRISESISSAKLQNVKIKILEEEPNARVFCYLHQSEVENFFKEKEERILSYIETGKKAEQRLQIDDALRNYYWALVLARTMPRNVVADFNDEKGSCLAVLPAKMKSMLSLIDIYPIDLEKGKGQSTAHIRFTYAGRHTASLQFSYFDGQGFVGPVMARDGVAELDFPSETPISQLRIKFETRFKEEAENLDPELRAAFSSKKLPIIDGTQRETALNFKKKEKKKSKEDTSVIPVVPPAKVEILPEKIIERKQVEIKALTDNQVYLPIIEKVEAAIANSNATIAADYFTEAGFQLFNTLLTKTGKVSLAGKSDYEFIMGNNQVLARFCKLKIKFRDGRTFMENMVMRFNPITKKIESIALALTRKAEEDIFRAAPQWTDVSRFTILNFMEDYQTAYALKRLDYIEQIFSDNALIITGTMVKPTQPHVAQPKDGQRIVIGDNKEVVYTKLTKTQFLNRLRNHFKSREYIHLTFEDNISHIINTNGRFPSGTAFAIQIRQIYNSPSYSDKGNLSLMMNTSGAQPIIEVRLWQPLKDKVVDLDTFFSNENFKW